MERLSKEFPKAVAMELLGQLYHRCDAFKVLRDRDRTMLSIAIGPMQRYTIAIGCDYSMTINFYEYSLGKTKFLKREVARNIPTSTEAMKYAMDKMGAW